MSTQFFEDLVNGEGPSGAGKKLRDMNSLQNLFQSDVTLIPDSNASKQLLERVNRNPGTLTSLDYQSAERLNSVSTSFLGPRSMRKPKKLVSTRNTGSKASNSSFIDRQLQSTMFKSKASSRRLAPRLKNNKMLYNSERTTLGRKEKKRNEERLKLIEERIISNTDSRKLVEQTNLMADDDLIERVVIQPRSEKHGKLHTQTWRDYGLLIAKGEVYESPNIRKPCQDCLGLSSWNEYECVVVCDGHGKSGEEVSWQVSNYISGNLVKEIATYVKANNGKENIPLNECCPNNVINKVFKYCDDEIIWSRELKNWCWAKIIGGEQEGLMCQITSPDLPMNEVLKPTSGTNSDDELIPVTLFHDGERSWMRNGRWQGREKGEGPPDRQLELPIEQKLVYRKYIRCERDFYGGSTCIAFVRNSKTNECLFATSGDSRVLVVAGPKGIQVNDDTVIKVRGSKAPEEPRFFAKLFKRHGKAAFRKDGLLSIEHNIHDPRELRRLNRDYPGKFIIGDARFNEGVDGYMYSNALFPFTGGITPTRGFGDRLYFGSGYVSTPEISPVMKLSPGSFVIGGSDGVFDDSIWGINMRTLVYRIAEMDAAKESLQTIIAEVKDETVARCFNWGHFRVDDISLFGLQIPLQQV